MKEVVLYRAKDGTLFDSHKKAENYTVDKICEEINEILKKKHFKNLTYIDLIEIIKHLAGTMENAKMLKRILDSNLYDDECKEE